MENFRDKRKENNAYERIKENYNKFEQERLQKLKDIERKLKVKKGKRDEQLEQIREKHLMKKRKQAKEKSKITKKGKKRR